MTDVKYDLVRKSFDQLSGVFGSAEVMFDAKSLDKSVSLPVVSPDGKYLVFTLHDYGTFSIWHREADLYLLDLGKFKAVKMSLNSDATESYHSWSSNGKWLVFSSKRGDGLTARPYFSYFISPDSTGKPFVLPQKDPYSINGWRRLLTGLSLYRKDQDVDSRDFVRASETAPVKPSWVNKTR